MMSLLGGRGAGSAHMYFVFPGINNTAMSARL